MFSVHLDPLEGCPNLDSCFSNRVYRGSWGQRRMLWDVAGSLPRPPPVAGVCILSSVLLPPQPCSYSIWPFCTFLPAMPLLSSYLHCTRGGCLRRLDRVPPFNQDVNQVFQNHPGEMWAVVQGDSSPASSFPPSLSSFPPSCQYIIDYLLDAWHWLC